MCINIFTDASVKHFPQYNYTVGCPGFIVFRDRQMIHPIDSHYIMDSTNNESEIVAIFNALYYVLCNKEAFKYEDRINIFSDSKISVFGLREWYKGWVKNMRDGILYNSSGKPVANSRFFVESMGMIMLINKKVNIYHCNGHIDLWNKTKIQKFMNTFRKENQCNRLLTPIERDFIIDGNNLVDELTGVVDLFNIDPQDMYRRDNTRSMFDIPGIINSIDFNHYEELIGDYKNIHLF